ncbi:Predicted arabinose efflux permease, MFS family [Edaphobacillus lindanitolerans]|uniref:Predicted arabinose efflux permease, MFS family n=1 Tax=Edaphobacillus lindanitolerans TaxID=550447 RepID=A0A1U7PQS8_9BACI|nr:MFS transporter [Edaphobacillus lindanitolerans]SIT93153.1 Predicted arabinose efflux permease, MFS family [Edaphobacillus lindanitolerans]
MAKIESGRARYWVLVMIVAISGFSQGMLLPLISVIFEQDGVSSTLNGLNATGLYIGTLIISPFMEAPLRRFGYKPVIVFGGLAVFLSLLLFPLWKSVMFWFVLRLIIGMGDNALHFATQTWITSTTPQERLGRNIAVYGLMFSAGFAVGPLFVPLIHVFEGLPFIVSGLLCMAAWSLVFLLKNDFPDIIQGNEASLSFIRRIRETMKVAWVAFIPPFGYGFLESSLNAIYPVYALREGIDVSYISFILAAFSVGAITSQIPLGMLSDRIGRRSVIIFALGGGAAAFFGAGFAGSEALGVLVAVFIAGIFVGSTFTLGISYMTDLTPKMFLPMGNLLCGIFFSVGSLTGPILGGYVVGREAGIGYLTFIAMFIALLFIVFLIGRPQPKRAV